MIEESPGKYCCFLHPKEDFELKLLSDECADCQKEYGFPLSTSPDSIGEYEIVKPLDRGFYSAVFQATTGRLNRSRVLKVTPVALYDYFDKDFEDECQLHADVAAQTEHLNDIIDFFDSDVAFGTETIPCHIAVLDFVEGTTLQSFMDEENASARTVAQLAIDLFRLLQELENKSRYHNDIHAKNLMVQLLRPEARRVDAISDSFRLIAVDLGSIHDGSKSAPHRAALGDLNAVAVQLLAFAGALLNRPDKVPDLDYRLASTLEEVGRSILSPAMGVRTPDYEECISQIREAHQMVVSPWRPPIGLRRMNDSYNAQTLHPSFVPKLLVDPGNEWRTSISISGPQLVTGMRGCGKTMLLRSLQIHCRLAELSADPLGSAEISEQLRGDGYVGLYVSCTRLLDGLGKDRNVLHEPYARLLVSYAREALRAVRHLSELIPDAPEPGWWRPIGRIVESAVSGCSGRLANSASDVVLEHRLHAILFSLDRNDEEHQLLTSPTIAFQELAVAIQSTAELWDTSKIFYLLDDVSTRHLNEDSIAELLSTLLFSNDSCAFKLTTEAQTFELLRSPGLNEKARVGRDFEPFDLAAAVSDRLNEDDGVKGEEFIAKILKARADQYDNHPAIAPAALLGSKSLEEIARQIVATTPTSKRRKVVYEGLNALTALCVGDIGDVISIYDAMLRKRPQGESVIPAETQNEAYQEYCSRRVYHLSRREGELKQFAFGFAQAAHELMLRSAAGLKDTDRKRLRQYAKLYIRITEGDFGGQFRKILELIDAGVFVLEGGVDAPRAKTRDADPIIQFVVSYRKLFGLTHYVGLAYSDRFELSGAHLSEWLDNPEQGAEILMRNLGGPLTAQERREAREYFDGYFDDDEGEGDEMLPFDKAEHIAEGYDHSEIAPAGSQVVGRVPSCELMGVEHLSSFTNGTAIFGLGFEDRTLASVGRVLESFAPTTSLLIEYNQPGHGPEIESLASAASARTVRIANEPLLKLEHHLSDGPVVVDVTGLAKPAIFAAVRASLGIHGEVYVVHTAAAEYYPLSESIEEVLSSPGDNAFETLDAAGALLSGELEPYTFHKLLDGEADPSRQRVLSAASSPKHERLLSLLDERPYDLVHILAPTQNTPRAELARLAAGVAAEASDLSSVEEVSTDDLDGALTVLARAISGWYRDEGFEIELALTGSKLHAVAAASVSAVQKISACWYVQPAEFDTDRFTLGVAQTRLYRIAMP